MAALFDGVRVQRRWWTDAVACDKGHDLPRVRRELRHLPIKVVIPEKHKPHARRLERPYVFDRAADRCRPAVRRLAQTVLACGDPVRQACCQLLGLRPAGDDQAVAVSAVVVQN